ncbi:MAG: FG-GAP-like repeat-containing protein, partial [Planctomycetes bacterium]|nr:FG-GAP-like repeat-containing protein [Planctomycetota bacterium]
FGGKKQAAADGVAQKSGLPVGDVVNLLGTLAPIVMGALGKKKKEEGLDASGVATALQADQAKAKAESGGILGMLDADGDGDLDLFLSNTAKWTTDTYEPIGRYYTGASTLLQLFDSEIERNVFYRNNGDGTFSVATAEAGLEGVGWGGDSAALDYDEDGDQDLLVTNMFGGSVLYRNDGKGR